MAGDSGEVAVMVRNTYYDGASPAQRVALMSGHDDPADADGEAARLNSVHANECVEYFVKTLDSCAAPQAWKRSAVEDRVG